MTETVFWSTYNGRQAGQVIKGLQVLLDQGVLEKEEQEVAKRIQRKLKAASLKEKEITMVAFNKHEDELVHQVEAALWR